ncbi:MAG: Gfo/Idh/MocA family oxidoreductase [Saprospiraceae bacterium]|nr:Gfo/Idh/MocA family oxidoreductase [Saprospiraceae bacterium]
MKDDQVRWGIIGVGDVCEKKSAPAMQLIANSSIEAVMRRNSEKAADYARRHQIAKWYDDASRLIEDKNINAIYIATPPSSHLKYTTMAAEAGKAVYVEKPMALNYTECQQMIAKCNEQGVPLYVAYYRRALANFLKVKEIIESGMIGEVRAVHIKLLKSAGEVSAQVDNWRVDPSISGGGHFVDLASHQLDFFDFIFGPVQKVHGLVANQAKLYEAEDIVTASFEFANGVIGSGLWCFTVAPNAEEETMQIIGSKGQVQFSCFGSPDIELQIDGQAQKKLQFEYPRHIQRPLIETIVADLLGQGTCASLGISASRTNFILDQILSGN